MLAVSQKVTPSSTAWRKIGSAVSSPRDQSSRFAGSPKLMQPNAMRLILSPDEPKRVYSMVMSFTRTECDGVRGCSVVRPRHVPCRSLVHHPCVDGSRWIANAPLVPTGPSPWPLDRRGPVSYTHLRAHETDSYLVCRLLLEKKKK